MNKQEEKITLSQKKDLHDLKMSANDCKKCDLWGNRNNVVFQLGNPDYNFMVVGGSPSSEEDIVGEPFAAQKGEVLQKMLQLVGFKYKEDVLLTQAVKCKPMEKGVKKSELKACQFNWLDKQIDIMKPKIILAMGDLAIQATTGKPDFRIKNTHGKLFKRGDGVMVFASYAPEDIYNSVDLQRETFQDMKTLQVAFSELMSNEYKVEFTEKVEAVNEDEIIGSKGVTEPANMLANDKSNKEVSLEKNKEKDTAKSWYSPILKISAKKRIVYGPLLIPDVSDSQAEEIGKEEIEKTAHGFLQEFMMSKDTKIDSMHLVPSDKLVLVESYIAPVKFELNGFEIPEGTWVVGVYVGDDDVWKNIENGELKGFSIQGYTDYEEV